MSTASTAALPDDLVVAIVGAIPGPDPGAIPGDKPAMEEEPTKEIVATPGIAQPRQKKQKSRAAGIEKLIKDATSARNTLKEVVDLVNRDPEVEHWKTLFQCYAQDAAGFGGALKHLLKMEVAAVIKRFSAAQQRGGEPDETDLLLHTFYNLNKRQCAT
ncbi:uncharacterized protein [Palaemon carinicauda]|uniref:uncharacterized protein n=1 Tax=Palaemon carinicauda TaxID=392227 RepID=UPI0035B637BF